MKILEIRSVRFRVGAVVKERNSGTRECELLAALDRLETGEVASGYRLSHLFDQVAADGLSALSGRQFHSIDQETEFMSSLAGVFACSSSKVPADKS